MTPFPGTTPDALGPAVRITRWYPEGPARIYEAFTDPAQLREWWRPRGFVVDELVFPAVAGASYLVRLRAPDGTRVAHTGVFLDVTPPASLTYTWRWIEGPMDPSETLVEIRFVPERGGTSVALCHSRFVNQDEADRHVGWREAFEALTAFLGHRVA